MTFPKQHSNCGLRSFRPMPVSRRHTAFQLIYLEDNIIFHFTDKDSRFGKVKKENFPCLLPEFHDTCSPQLLHPLLPPNPLLCDYFFLSSRSKPSSFFFFFQEMTPCQHPLVMTIYGGTRWDTWEMLRLERVFHSSLLLFPLLPATRPQTHIGGCVLCGSLYVKLLYVYLGI